MAGGNKEISALVTNGIQYLDVRADFWRQQKPIYARVNEQKQRTMRGTSKATLKWVLFFVVVEKVFLFIYLFICLFVFCERSHDADSIPPFSCPFQELQPETFHQQRVRLLTRAWTRSTLVKKKN